MNLEDWSSSSICSNLDWSVGSAASFLKADMVFDYSCPDLRSGASGKAGDGTKIPECCIKIQVSIKGSHKDSVWIHYSSSQGLIRNFWLGKGVSKY